MKKFDADFPLLTDEDIVVAYGWFSFGQKSAVTSNPPHANLTARKASIDRLLLAGLITHKHETQHGGDQHIYGGTAAMADLLGSDRARNALTAALSAKAPVKESL